MTGFQHSYICLWGIKNGSRFWGPCPVMGTHVSIKASQACYSFFRDKRGSIIIYSNKAYMQSKVIYSDVSVRCGVLSICRKHKWILVTSWFLGRWRPWRPRVQIGNWTLCHTYVTHWYCSIYLGIRSQTVELPQWFFDSEYMWLMYSHVKKVVGQ